MNADRHNRRLLDGEAMTGTRGQPFVAPPGLTTYARARTSTGHLLRFLITVSPSASTVTVLTQCRLVTVTLMPEASSS